MPRRLDGCMDCGERSMLTAIAICLTFAGIVAVSFLSNAAGSGAEAEASEWTPAKKPHKGHGDAAAASEATMMQDAAAPPDDGSWRMCDQWTPCIMSAEAIALEMQAEIAQCMAGEARTMVAAWELDMRSSRGHVPPAYEEGLGRMIAAGADSARTTGEWADTAVLAAADGLITAAEAEALDAAETGMADAKAAAFEAYKSITGKQRQGFDPPVPSIATGHILAPVLSGDGTDCY